jgi:hypothetical protein
LPSAPVAAIAAEISGIYAAKRSPRKLCHSNAVVPFDHGAAVDREAKMIAHNAEVEGWSPSLTTKIKWVGSKRIGNRS